MVWTPLALSGGTGTFKYNSCNRSFFPYALGGSFSQVCGGRIFSCPLSDIFRKSVPKLPPIPLLFLLLEMAIFGPLPTQTRRSKENMSLYPRIHTHPEQYSHLDDTLLNGSRHSEKRKGEGRAAIKIICSEQKHTIPLGVGALKTRGRWGERIPRMPKAFRNSNRSFQSVDLNVMNTQDNIQN